MNGYGTQPCFYKLLLRVLLFLGGGVLFWHNIRLADKLCKSQSQQGLNPLNPGLVRSTWLIVLTNPDPKTYFIKKDE